MDEDLAWDFYPLPPSPSQFIQELMGPKTMERIESKNPGILHELTVQDLWERMRALPQTFKTKDPSLNVTLSIARREVGLLALDPQTLRDRMDTVEVTLFSLLGSAIDRESLSLLLQRVPSLLLFSQDSLSQQLEPTVTRLKAHLPYRSHELWKVFHSNPLLLLEDFDQDILPRLTVAKQVSCLSILLCLYSPSPYTRCIAWL